MPSDRVVVEFVVTAEIPTNTQMDDTLAALVASVEDSIPEAANVFADIMDVDPIT